MLSVHPEWRLLIENEEIITVLRVMEDTLGTQSYMGLPKSPTGTQKVPLGVPPLSPSQHPMGPTSRHRFFSTYTVFYPTCFATILTEMEDKVPEGPETNGGGLSTVSSEEQLVLLLSSSADFN